MSVKRFPVTCGHFLEWITENLNDLAIHTRASQVVLVVGKASACQCGRRGFYPWLGRCPGVGNDYPLQFSCLKSSMGRGAWWAQRVGVTKSWTRLSWPCKENECKTQQQKEQMLFYFQGIPFKLVTNSLNGEGNGTPLHFSHLENPKAEEPGRLQSLGSLRVGHDWATSLSVFTFMHWRRKWQPTPVFLPGESQGRRSLVGSHLWGCTESDTTEAT